MLNIKTTNSNGVKYSVNLPTNANEIDKDYLVRITQHIKVANNYSLIALVVKERLSSVLLAYNQKKRLDSPVIPCFVKAGKVDGDSTFIKDIHVADPIIIAPSQIALGHHINNAYNELSVDKILDMIKDDKSVYQKVVQLKDYCYFLEFKIVPNCDIKGVYDTNVKHPNRSFILQLGAKEEGAS